MENKKLKWTDIGQEDVYFSYEDDPVLKKFIEKKGGFTYDISKLIQNTPYAGSSTSQEMRELEMNMKELISEGKYGYKYIENFLLSLNYNLNKIRRVFKKLTGVDPDVYLDTQPYLNTPGSIPQINYGWGESKNKNYDYLFIMPWDQGYCIFGQKGDVDREIVSKYNDLDSARIELSKKVKELYQFDRILTEKDLEKKKSVFTPEDMPMGIKTAENIMKETEDDDLVEEIKKQEFFDKETPKEFLDEVNTEDIPVVDIVKSIFSYIKQVSSKIKGYVISIKGFKYISKYGEEIETTPLIKGLEIEKTSFEVPAIFSIIIEIEKDKIKKKGLMIFLYKDGEISSNGTFKGENKKIYGFSKEGIDSYFEI